MGKKKRVCKKKAPPPSKATKPPSQSKQRKKKEQEAVKPKTEKQVRHANKNEEGGTSVRDEEFNDEFSAVIQYGGEFVFLNDGRTIYRGGMSSLVSGLRLEEFTLDSIHRLVMGWGYREGTYRIWTLIREIYEDYFQIRKDDDCYDFATYNCVNRIDGELFIEHDVVDIGATVRLPRCVNEVGEMEGSDEEEVEGLGDSEDERATALVDGFEGIDISLPQKEVPKVAEYVSVSKEKPCEEDEYVSDELESSDPDLSDSEKAKVQKFEKFKKEHLNRDFKFQWGMEFNSLDEFRYAIREWSVLNGRQITFVKNESDRVRVVCRATCGFLMLCSKVGHKRTFAIKTIVDKHTCARVLDNKSANSRWVAKIVLKKMQTSQDVRITDIIQDLRQNYSVGITVCRAWKAKLIAKKMLEGDADRQYAILRRYAAELLRASPGNTLAITVERPNPTIPPRFGCFYFCFEGCKKGFINGCRPFVGVDGCHLKTKYGGQLLIAVGRDPNDQYFPLAFGVVETETKESWKWFLELLMNDVGQSNRYVFISDQQKGLVAVFEEMFERIEHRVCLRHLYANFRKKFGGGALIRDLMMEAAKATYYQGWLQKMNELKLIDLDAWTWLMGVPPKSWCKHAFSFYPKCDVLMNNISESFNATILSVRDKPILTMCEWIRLYLMNRCSASSAKLKKWPHKVMPIPRKRLDKEVMLSGHWLPTWAMDETFEVNHSYNGQKFVVDIAKRSCTCNFWELVGIPCRHAIAALSFRQQNPEDFVDSCYHRDKYAICYSFPISPINGEEMWPEVDADPIMPPMYKRGPGRPKKLRIRECGEEGARRRRLPGVSYRCTICDKFGHNAQTCKSTTQNPNALKRKKKVKLDAQTTATHGAETGATDVPQSDATDGVQTDATHGAESGATAVTQTAATDGVQSAATDGVQTETNQTDFFGDITDDVISSLPEFNSTQCSAVDGASQRRGKKKMSPTKPIKRRTSERQKLFWFKKPITGPGATSEQPISVTDEDNNDESRRGKKKLKKNY
ncbi:uncharacterized protein LOC131655613 [Vicia villosa]|uniref:uncharacterized protein LOC131655613 n=1 Tax=Vicia villosa TaxID=3911 RepID=UPI00273C6A19|nr:uncharacterized protein LOC131655613 [Vicia villosa]